MRPLRRILFFGTPDFAVPTLEALVAAGRPPVAVVTQPSRPVGRGQKVQPPPVAVAAERHGLDVLQPVKVREAAFLEQAAALDLDVAVVVAFGQIFPKALLELPAAGCLNLHASLLPAWRGAAPIQAAVAAGQERTGVTTMVMEEGLDSGPMLLTAETSIGPRETAGELAVRLAEMGGELMVRTLEALEEGAITPRAQDDGEATYAPRIRKEDGLVDWRLPARQVYDRLRAHTPWPGATAQLRERPVKILWGEVREDRDPGPPDLAPGTVLAVAGGEILVRCGEGPENAGVFAIQRLQRPGKKPAAAADFANGERLVAYETTPAGTDRFE